MAINDWVDVETIKALSKHTSAAVVAVLGFSLVGVLIRFGLSDGALKQALEIVDGFILIGLFVVLGYKVITLTARGSGHGLLAA